MFTGVPTYSDVVRFEEDNNFSKDEVVLLADTTPELGSVLGKITSGGKFQPMDPDAVDGSEVAAGVLVAITTAPTAEADGKGYAIVRHAIVNKSGLVWLDGVDAGEKTTAYGELKEIGVLAK